MHLTAQTQTHTHTRAETAETAKSLLIRALRGKQTERIPVWFMRQAGRSLPEYRRLRAQRSLMEIVRSPELAAEATLQPVRRYGVDGAILFSDIVAPLEAIGVGVELRPGVGPVIEQPIRRARDLEALRAFTPPEDAPWLEAAVRLACAELSVPLIGFAGGPFTLASYLVEGGPSKAQARTKALMLSDPHTWRALLERLAAISLASLQAQVRAGAGVVQIFDSWIGALSAAHYERHVLPVVRELFERLRELSVPRIYFGVGTSHLLELMATAGPDAISLDWRTPLERARELLPGRIALQGNLDPAICLAPWETLEPQLSVCLEHAPHRGYVFSLGHGVLPETDPEVLARVVERVHAWQPVSRTGAAA